MTNNQTLVQHDWLKRWAFLGLSLLINSVGHALTVVMNLGSAVWTASAVNLYHLMATELTSNLVYLWCRGGDHECNLNPSNYLAANYR